MSTPTDPDVRGALEALFNASAYLVSMVTSDEVYDDVAEKVTRCYDPALEAVWFERLDAFETAIFAAREVLNETAVCGG